MSDISINELASFCKKKGFVFPNSDIYGGIGGFFDLGPLGVELKNNIKSHYWNDLVRKKDFMVGIDGSIITHPKVWKASGHVDNFFDYQVSCDKCKNSFRADSLIEEILGIDADGLAPIEMEEIIKKNKIVCPKCKGSLGKPVAYSLMFSTNVGAGETGMISYLRPETAQSIFVNFKNVVDSQRLKLPFGIAQIGKAFRNEISPRNFLFRLREIEQIEIEFFAHPKKIDECPYFDKIKDFELLFLARENQSHDAKSKKEMKVKIKDLLKRSNPWQLYWLYEVYSWYVRYGVKEANLRVREHLKDELAHYAKSCFDIDYKFSFGWKEICGNADRGNFDLSQHAKFSKAKFEIFDEESKEKVMPVVVSEPSFGVERAILTILSDAYEYDSERENVVLHFSPKLAPVKFGVFPLIKDEKLIRVAKGIYEALNQRYNVFYDEGGSIGRRYSRQDEIGTPFCITADFESLEDGCVTIRDRDSKLQQRFVFKNIRNICEALLYGEIKIK